MFQPSHLLDTQATSHGTCTYLGLFAEHFGFLVSVDSSLEAACSVFEALTGLVSAGVLEAASSNCKAS